MTRSNPLPLDIIPINIESQADLISKKQHQSLNNIYEKYVHEYLL